MKVIQNGTILLSVGILAVFVGSAFATMPSLTQMPAKRSVKACSNWARHQYGEAISMWGIDTNGGSDDALGLHRLTSACLNEPVSDIVGFGSSAGFDEQYCTNHPDARICTRQ